jgi:CRP-like cAMP-binding protein
MTTVSSSFSIDTERLINLGIKDPRAPTSLDIVKSGVLTSDERLFCSIWASPLLSTLSFEPKRRLLTAGQLVDEAYMVVSGSLIATRGEEAFRLGPGSVLGLAEGITNMPSSMTVVTVTSVQVRMIPLQKIDVIFLQLPPELKAILRTIVKRILGLS